MKIQWLGTAAAEGWPAIFCQCEHCREAAARGGREIRTRSGALIDDVLLIDLNPDLYHQKLTHQLDLGNVRDVLVTHRHGDHFQPSVLHFLAPVYAHRDNPPPLRVHASSAVLEQLPEDPHYTLHTRTPGDQFETQCHSVTVLPAVHGAPLSQFFLIERDNTSILYAHDTDLFSDEAWDILQARVRQPISLVSMDCTNGPLPHNYIGHMGFEDNIAMKEQLLARGLADANTRFICNHFSHNGGTLYREATERMAPHGFDISYDGMIVQLG